LKKVAPKCLSISEKRLSSDSRDEDMSGVSGGIKKVINLFATDQAAKHFADGVSDVPRRFSFTFYRSKKTPKAFSEHPREGARREIGNGLCSSKRTHTSQPRGSRQPHWWPLEQRGKRRKGRSEEKSGDVRGWHGA
jgi:hypothetical protein